MNEIKWPFGTVLTPAKTSSLVERRNQKNQPHKNKMEDTYNIYLFPSNCYVHYFIGLLWQLYLISLNLIQIASKAYLSKVGNIIVPDLLGKSLANSVTVIF